MSSSPLSFLYHFYLVGLGNTVGQTNRYELDGPATDPPVALSPTQPPVHLAPGVFPGG
jgi:hypothetical protein